MKPTKKFIDDFNIAMQYYECTLEEVRFEKQRCVANMRDAEVNYHHVAKNIRLLFGDKLK